MLHEIRGKKELVRRKVEATKKKLRTKSKESRKELTQTEVKNEIFNLEFLMPMRTHQANIIVK